MACSIGGTCIGGMTPGAKLCGTRGIAPANGYPEGIGWTGTPFGIKVGDGERASG
jgi:hypothetical protein